MKPEEEYILIGDEFIKKAKYAKAAGEYRKAIEVNYNSAKNHFKLGAAYYFQGNKEENEIFLNYAVLSFRKAIELDPYYEEAHHHLIEISYKMNTLDILAVEYNNKIKQGINPEFYKKLLKVVAVVSAVPVNKTIYMKKKKISLFTRVFFDYILLSFSLLTILVSIMSEHAKPLMPLGFTMLGMYLAYKIFTIYLLDIKFGSKNKKL